MNARLARANFNPSIPFEGASPETVTWFAEMDRRRFDMMMDGERAAAGAVLLETERRWLLFCWRKSVRANGATT